MKCSRQLSISWAADHCDQTINSPDKVPPPLSNHRLQVQQLARDWAHAISQINFVAFQITLMTSVWDYLAIKQLHITEDHLT